MHLLVSWREYLPWKTAADTFKRVIGMQPSKQIGPTGTRWFSRGQSRKRVTTRDHFDYLIDEYLPKHVAQHGTFWRQAGE